MILKIVYGILAAMFALSVAVQYNDPDPFQWMLLYAIPFVYMLLGAFGRYNAIAGGFAILYLIGGLYWMPWGNMGPAMDGAMQWKMKSPANELYREALGIFICAFAFAFHFACWWSNRAK
jgi:hypothetical protein